LQILFEVLEVLGAVFSAFFKMLWDLLPSILEIKQFFDWFTPKGMIAAYIGVPLFVVSIAIWLGRKVLKDIFQ